MSKTHVKTMRERNHKKRSWKQKLFIIAMLAYPVLQFLVFWLYVNADTLILTFSRFDYKTGDYVFWGFQRYAEVFEKMILGQDVAMRNMFLNSFHAIAINLLILPIAVITAYAFYKKVPGGKVYRVLFFLPSMISLVVLTMVYRYMFNSEFGPISAIFKFFKGESPIFLSTSQNYLWTLIYIFCIWAGLGSNVILMGGAMGRIPKEITESLRIDGVGFWRELWSFVVPMIMPTLGVFVLTALMSCATFVTQPMFIAINGGELNKYMTVGWYIFETVQGTESDILYSATVGVVFSTVCMPIIILGKIIIDRLTPDVSF